MIGKPRTILTTDMECDDMNSMIHLFLYLNELDLEGIVYTSSQFHFNGDGIHTLGEVTPHYCCLGQKETDGPMPDREPDPRAKDLMNENSSLLAHFCVILWQSVEHSQKERTRHHGMGAGHFGGQQAGGGAFSFCQ